ncbi:MAG: hypothetical protein U0X87_10035 [Anaerolineales bacterium]
MTVTAQAQPPPLCTTPQKNKTRTPIQTRTLTASLHVDYIKPTPLGNELEVRGKVKKSGASHRRRMDRCERHHHRAWTGHRRASPRSLVEELRKVVITEKDGW